MSETPTPAPNPPAPAPDGIATSARKPLLIVTSLLLLGWFAWLSITALTKSREPIVSRAQASAARVPVVAEVTTEPAEREVKMLRGGVQGHNVLLLKSQADKPAFVVTVKEKLVPNGPDVGTKIGVTNLPVSSGYEGPGDYLLLLDADDSAILDGQPAYFLQGQQRSPGADLESVGAPMIYKWGPDVRAQVKRLYPEK
jgi:hypothetical protein